ncbi:MAG: MFS transporter [Clostridia bacterium]|nr:MFS transporter [Clostridia bacterium]
MKKNQNTVGLHPFLMLWGSQSVSAMGTAMTNYALVIWVYNQNGTASSISVLTLCSFLPTILFRFLAGAIADRWDKKRIMLISDLLAACGTFATFALYATSTLRIVHLYVINFLLSLMNAFQVPAAYVATSSLVPREYYARADGLQAISNALISILSPVLGSIVLTRGSMRAVLAIDLITFAIAFLTLLFIRIPKIEGRREFTESFRQTCLSGLRYLKEHLHILRLIGYIAAVNFLAKLGPDGLMSAFILSRTNGDQAALGAVQSAVALGLLTGGTLATFMKPTRDHVRMVFIMCCLIFIAGIALALGTNTISWVVAAFLQYLFAAVMNVHWSALMRSVVPLDVQGRVFSVRDTLQNCTIPLGLYWGGALADFVFEPLMARESANEKLFSIFFGSGSGAGIAVLFFLVSTAGLALSVACMNMRIFRNHHSDE